MRAGVPMLLSRSLRRALVPAGLALIAIAPAQALEFATIEHGGARFTLCRVAVGSDRLAVFLHDESGRPFNRLDRLAAHIEARGQKLPFAMNAGMFQPGFAPVGLLVSGGRELTPLNVATGTGNFFLQPNGVFLVTHRGAQIVATADYANVKDGVELATQSGPLLLHGGTVHAALRPDSTSRHIRNGVGVASADSVVFVISESPITLHAFALMFRDALGCGDALYLDGVISSLRAPNLNRCDTHADLGPIIAVVE